MQMNGVHVLCNSCAHAHDGDRGRTDPNGRNNIENMQLQPRMHDVECACVLHNPHAHAPVDDREKINEDPKGDERLLR